MGVFDFLPGLSGGDGAADTGVPGDSTDASAGGADAVADPAPAEFRERAESLAGRSDVPTLDFTVDSLARLDDLAGGPSTAVDDELAYGSYLGETLVRAFGGEWTDEDGRHVAVPLSDDRTRVAVFDAAAMSIDGEPVFAEVAARLEAEGADRSPSTTEFDARSNTATTESEPDSNTEPSEAVGSTADTAADRTDPPTDSNEVPETTESAPAGSAADPPPSRTGESDSVAADDSDGDLPAGGDRETVVTDRDVVAANRATVEERETVLDDSAGDDRVTGQSDGDASGTDRSDVLPVFETRDPEADVAADAPVAPDRYALRTAVEAFAADWPDRKFDVTPDSLPRLDAFVDDQWAGRFRERTLAERAVDHDADGDPLTQVGAYYGEVLVRRLDGEWVATEDGEGAVAVSDIGERTERVDVFTAARECLAGPSTFASRYDALVNGLYVDESTVSDGRAAVCHAERDSLTSGEVITQFAAAAEAFVEERPGYPLDYSPRSLGSLDDVAADEFRGEDVSDVPLAEDTDPDSLRLTARATAAGAYFAAVLLRHRDAQWRIGDDVELVIDGPDGERVIDPVSTAADCLRGDDAFVDAYSNRRD